MPRKKLCSPFCFMFTFTMSGRACCRVAEAPQSRVWCSALQHPDLSCRQGQQHQLPLQELWGPCPPSVATTHRSPHCRATSSPCPHHSVPWDSGLWGSQSGEELLAVCRDQQLALGRAAAPHMPKLPLSSTPRAGCARRVPTCGCRHLRTDAPPKIRGLHNSPASRR